MSKAAKDLMIIGQGLAGSTLALALRALGVSVQVFDDPRTASASSIAAALINPLPGRRLTKPPRLDKTLPFAIQWYREHGPFFNQQPLLRLFREERELNAAEERLNDPGYQSYLGDWVSPTEGVGPVRNNLGGVWVQGGGVLDVSGFLDHVKTDLQSRGELIQQSVNHDDIRWASDSVSIAGHYARKLVFCEGAAFYKNPWFDWMPVTPLKGETLTIRTRQPIANHIIIRKHWLVPLAKPNEYKFGATFVRGDTNALPTTEGRRQLLSALEDMVPDLSDYEVIGHQAGIRPGRQANIPLLGFHPEFPNAGVFNGLASKGALLAPYYATQLAQHIASGDDLPEQSDIAHYYPLENA